MNRPVWMILIGFVMVLLGGIVMPFLMLPGVGVFPLDRVHGALAWILPFSSYSVSVAGLFLGLIGSATYVRMRKPPHSSTRHEERSNPYSHS
jgi:hypothetical protein